ncbi:MAG TPA: MarR family transcriptional regulator [Prolixibacteraceae bacterium]|nr:MarR family transcriptional regulator [Prolixibacteraceae bacterium]
MDSTDILIKIRKIVRSINLESKKIQKEYGVSIPQVLSMNYLYQSKNFQATQGEIKNFLNLNPSTTSGIINRLEGKGLLARLPKSGDKRVVNIILTSKGADLLQQIPALLHEQLSQKLAELDKNTLEQTKASLDLLINLLEINKVNAWSLITEDDYLEESKNEAPNK